MESKTCSKCKEEKDISEFHKNSYSKDGYQAACKDCRNKTKRKWNEKNRDRISEYNMSKKDKNRERARKALAEGRWKS